MQNTDKAVTDARTVERVTEFERLGFTVEDTGGGCQWLRKPLASGLSLVITNGEAELPDHEGCMYLISEDSTQIAQGDLMPVAELVELIGRTCV